MDITLVIVLVILILALSACVPAGPPPPHAPVIPPQFGSWLGGLFTFLLTIALITLLVAAVVIAYTYFTHRAEADQSPTHQPTVSASPLEIARQRYATPRQHPPRRRCPERERGVRFPVEEVNDGMES